MEKSNVDELLSRLDKSRKVDADERFIDNSRLMLSSIRDFSGIFKFLHIDFPCDVFIDGVGPFPSLGHALACSRFGLRHIEDVLKCSGYDDAVSSLLNIGVRHAIFFLTSRLLSVLNGTQ